MRSTAASSSSPLSSFTPAFSSFKDRSNSSSLGYNQYNNNPATNNLHSIEVVEGPPSPQLSPKFNSVKTLLNWHLLRSKGNHQQSYLSYNGASTQKEQMEQLNNQHSSFSKQQRRGGRKKHHHRRFFSDTSVTVPVEVSSSSPPPTSRDTQKPLSWSEHKQDITVTGEETNSPQQPPTMDNGNTPFHQNSARIIVSCIAHTSYKLSSANPSSMDQDIYGTYCIS